MVDIVKEIEVSAGDVNDVQKSVSSTRITIFAKQWKNHEKYDRNTGVNNIALIHLTIAFPITDNIATAYLNHQRELVPLGKYGLFLN